jgi:hypothetical protein
MAFIISLCSTLSTSLKLTSFLKASIKSSTKAELFNGLLKSRACAAVINSIASTFSTLLITRKHLVAAFAPMLTWSSWLLLEEMLSTLEGVHYCLFSLTIPASVYWGIMNPLFKPASFTRNNGRFLCPLIN